MGYQGGKILALSTADHPIMDMSQMDFVNMTDLGQMKGRTYANSVRAHAVRQIRQKRKESHPIRVFDPSRAQKARQKKARERAGRISPCIAGVLDPVQGWPVPLQPYMAGLLDRCQSLRSLISLPHTTERAQAQWILAN